MKLTKSRINSQNFLDCLAPEELKVEEERLIVSFLVQKTRNTQRAYRKEISDFLEFLKGKSVWTLKSCRTSHCAEFLTRKAHLKPASIKRSKDALSSLMTFMQKVGFLSSNPFLALDSTPIEDLRSHRSLSKSIIKRLLEAEGSLRDRCLVRFMYVTGLRREEVHKVKFSHFKIEADIVYLTVFGKGRKIRTLALGKEFYSNYLLPLKPKSKKDSFVFRPVTSDDRALSVDRIYEIVKAKLLAAGAPTCASPHWLRHSHGTHAAENGINLRVLQKSLGHASLATTQIYLDSSTKHSSALVVDQILEDI